MNEKTIVRVRDVMKTELDMVDRMDTVGAALNKMAHIETKTLLVEKRDEYDEYGVVTLSDIANHVIAQDRAPNRVNIYEIMTKPLISVPPDMNIRHCARLFQRLHLSRAPVVEERKVIGIVSFTDMVIKGLRNR